MAAISSSAILTSFSVLSPNLKEVNRVSISTLSGNIPSCYKAVARDYRRTTGNCLITRAKTSIQPEVYMEGVIHKVVPVEESTIIDGSDSIEVVTIHHVGLLCENLERSLDFYQNILGLKTNEARPNDKLPYRGAWLWVGS
ncbi:hypothetical protein GIB67_041709 [Kingdonia uniflora]|uniref:VOC domain-containing protein n=1 Tax=Kingdonia uniflora TaxID=39325 RepID=A0A7J7MRA8_9MAGN|nr:hypothetical protein GIB67_041709 [Kingdonia uniflora]